MRKKTVIVAAIASIALTGIGLNACDTTTETSASAESTASSTPTTPTPSPEQIEAKRAADQAERDRAAAAKAERDRVAAAAQAERDRVAAAAAEAERARLDPAAYPAISVRDYAMLVKDPNAHKGQRFVVYGVVTQFDAATGTSTLRANTAATPQDRSYDYDQNTIVESTVQTLGPVIEDDFVTFYVEVVGSYSYATQIGGNTTVPKLKANIVQVTRSAA